MPDWDQPAAAAASHSLPSNSFPSVDSPFAAASPLSGRVVDSPRAARSLSHPCSSCKQLLYWLAGWKRWLTTQHLCSWTPRTRIRPICSIRVQTHRAETNTDLLLNVGFQPVTSDQGEVFLITAVAKQSIKTLYSNLTFISSSLWSFLQVNSWV